MLLPTIHFAGNCNEVIEFYKQKLNAEVLEIAYAKDGPAELAAELPPSFVMFSKVKILGALVSLTDGCENPPSAINFTYTVICDTPEEVAEAFNALAEGGQVTAPLRQEFWADLTGDVTDRFGVNWNFLTLPN